MEINIKCKYTKMEDIEKIIPNPKNDIIHKPNADLIKRLADVIKYQGVRKPIIVSSKSGYIVTGHALYTTLKELGCKQAPIDIQEFENEDQEIAHLIADNSLNSWREINLAAVNEIVIPSLDGMNFDFEMLAIKDFTLDVSEKEKPNKKPKLCPNCGAEL